MLLSLVVRLKMTTSAAKDSFRSYRDGMVSTFSTPFVPPFDLEDAIDILLGMPNESCTNAAGPGGLEL